MATIKKWITDNSYFGKAAVSKNQSGSVYAFDKSGAFILLYKYGTKAATFGMASSRGVQMSDGITYYLITLKTKFKSPRGIEYEFAYVSNQDFYFSQVRADDEAKAKNDAQVLFNSLVASDKKLLVQINTRYALILEAKKRGVNVDAAGRKLTEIVEAYTRRQEAIKTNPAIKVTNYFKLSGIHGIGIAPIVIGLAIGAGAVLAGLTVYYFLKPEYNTSQLHSTYLEEHEAELRAALGDEKYEEMKKVVDGEIKSTAQTAFDEGGDEGFFSKIKTIGLVAAGVALFMLLKPGGKSA